MSFVTQNRHRFLIALLSVLLSASTVAAQAVDRAKLLQEIVTLNAQLKFTTDPAAVKDLTAQVLAKEAQFLAPAPEDLAQFSAFLQQPYTGIVRLMPREQFSGLLLTREGGAFYSFASLVHQYGFGSDLLLEQGSFSVGFAGANFGMLLALGNTALETISTETPGVAYLTTFAPPLDEPGARLQQQRVRGFSENGFNYANRLTATVGQTYIVRSVEYRAADVLVAFRPFRRDTDGSLLLQWKLLKRYPSPNLNGGVIANVSAASYAHTSFAPGSIVSLFGKELTDGVYLVETTSLPQAFGRTQVNVQDNSSLNRRSGLFAGTPEQINFLIPPDAVEGYGLITVTTPSGNFYGELVNIAKVAPGLFSANANGSGVAAAVALRVNGNRQTFEPVARLDTATNRFVTVPLDLGAATDQLFVILFGTGWRQRSSLAAVSLQVGGTDAEVSFAAAQGSLVGLDQANLRVPRSLIGRGLVDLVLTADGRTANTVQIRVK